MKALLHGTAGLVAFVTIILFWTATLAVELFGSASDISAVKSNIVLGLAVLIPAMAVASASGMSLGRSRNGALTERKSNRMRIIAANGVLVLIPAAVFLANRAGQHVFDIWFYTVQAAELAAGGVNVWLMGLNIRDGLRLSGRFHARPTRRMAQPASSEFQAANSHRR
ncbi:MAG: hypothetical protein AAFZ58_06970 [Pseudomonadota bacterium]